MGPWRAICRVANPCAHRSARVAFRAGACLRAADAGGVGADGLQRAHNRSGSAHREFRGGAEARTVIFPDQAVRMVMAARPVDFRKGHDGAGSTGTGGTGVCAAIGHQGGLSLKARRQGKDPVQGCQRDRVDLQVARAPARDPSEQDLSPRRYRSGPLHPRGLVRQDGLPPDARRGADGGRARCVQRKHDVARPRHARARFRLYLGDQTQEVRQAYVSTVGRPTTASSPPSGKLRSVTVPPCA